MTRDKHSELFLLIQTQLSYATAAAAAVGFARANDLSSGNLDGAKVFADVLRLLNLCEFQAAMDASDRAGFTPRALPSLIETQRQVGRLMAELAGKMMPDEDTQRIELSAVSSSDRFAPSDKQDAQNARTRWTAEKKRADQLEATLGKVWYWLAGDGDGGTMTVNGVEEEFTVKDSCAVNDAVEAFKRENF